MVEAEEMLMALTVDELRGRGRAGGEAAQVRQVGRRLFVLRDQSWTDLRLDPSLKVIEVAPFSEAYFELVKRLPSLAAYFALGERVVIAGDGLALRVAPEGITRWGSRNLTAVLAAFEESH